MRETLAIPWSVLGIVQIVKFERSLSVTKVFSLMKTFVNEMSYSPLCSATCCGLELPITVQLQHTSFPSPLSMLMGYKHLAYQPDSRSATGE